MVQGEKFLGIFPTKRKLSKDEIIKYVAEYTGVDYDRAKNRVERN